MSTYVDQAEAVEYFSHRLNSCAWDNATLDQQDASLLQATEIVDQLPLTGYKATKEQELRFPRAGQTTVPQDVKNACCDIALALLDGRDPEEDFMELSRSGERYASLRTQRDTLMTEDHIVAGMPSARAYRYLAKYIRAYQSITLRRTS